MRQVSWRDDEVPAFSRNTSQLRKLMGPLPFLAMGFECVSTPAVPTLAQLTTHSNSRQQHGPSVVIPFPSIWDVTNQ
jgi:hypothetical protein